MSSEWTIDTLKEHFEQKFSAQEDKLASDVALLKANARLVAEALVKQANEYERRLSDLNHEAARINAANATNVSREVYESDKKSGDEWRRRVESLIAEVVTRDEFQSYKESTSTALTLQAGKAQGVQGTGQFIFAAVLGGAALLSIAVGLSAFLATRSNNSPQTPNIYVTPPVSPAGSDATVKVKP